MLQRTLNIVYRTATQLLTFFEEPLLPDSITLTEIILKLLHTLTPSTQQPACGSCTSHHSASHFLRSPCCLTA
jgi:hypothetical protein